MKNHTLFALWGGLFALCAVLGFIPNPDGALRIVLTLLSVVFFVPGGLLLCRKAYRCPHCRKPLQINHQNQCPHCKESLDV